MTRLFVLLVGLLVLAGCQDLSKCHKDEYGAFVCVN